MALLLSEARANDDPVPVVVPLADWVDERTLIEWLVDTLADEHLHLSRTALLALIVTGRVLPMFDGLDEIAPSRRAAFLTSLERSDLPFVFTCRPAEHQAAVAQVALPRAAGGCTGTAQPAQGARLPAQPPATG